MVSNEGRNNQELYKKIVESMPYFVYVLDADACLMACNQNVKDLVNVCEINDMEGTFYQALETTAKWSKERVARLKSDDIEAILQALPQRDVMEPPIVESTGSILYLSATRVPLLDDKNKVTACAVFLRDISEQRALEEQLSTIKDKLYEYNAKPAQSATPIKTEKFIQPNVLLIEDNSVAQKAGKALLMQLDCKVGVADSVESLEENFKPGKYDIVFMDIGLKDTSGYMLSKCIRALEQNTPHHVPIIALTSYEADIVKYDCEEYFMEGAITKPLTTEQAKQIIQHYIYHIDIPVKGLKRVERGGTI